MSAFAEAHLYSEFVAAQILRSPKAHVVGQAIWVFALICTAVWLWWPAAVLAGWVSLNMTRLARALVAVQDHPHG